MGTARRFIWISLGLLVGLLVGAVVGIRTSRPKPLDLNSDFNWTTIREYDGVLDPDEGEVHARVGVISRFKDGSNGGETILQNRIEVTNGTRKTVFMWPNRIEYAAGRCEIEDIDQDGKKEFLLFWDHERALRVVAYEKGRFQFREKLDELAFLDRPVERYGVGRWDETHFLIYDRNSESSDFKNDTALPRIASWSRERGFQETKLEVSPGTRLVGKWKTRVLRGRSVFVLDIVANQGRISGDLVTYDFVNKQESRSLIYDVQAPWDEMTFTAMMGKSVVHWRLYVPRNGDKGVLHGSCGEMLIEEPVERE